MEESIEQMNESMLSNKKEAMPQTVKQDVALPKTTLLQGDFVTFEDITSYSPLTLAFIGDSVYEMVIRTIIISQGNRPVNKLNKMTSNLAKAGTQAKMIRCLQEVLSEEEMKVFKRGRNAKSFTMAKNATVNDYLYATGFEALIGYLYILGNNERIVELIQLGIEKIGEMKQ